MHEQGSMNVTTGKEAVPLAVCPEGSCSCHSDFTGAVHLKHAVLFALGHILELPECI